MTAAEILRSLQRPKRDKRDIVDAIRRRAKVTQIVAALSESDNALTRQILCDVLGSRAEPEAVPALVAALDDGSEGVRAAAADSIRTVALVAGGHVEASMVRPEDVRARSACNLAEARGPTRLVH